MPHSYNIVRRHNGPHEDEICNRLRLRTLQDTDISRTFSNERTPAVLSIGTMLWLYRNGAPWNAAHALCVTAELVLH